MSSDVYLDSWALYTENTDLTEYQGAVLYNKTKDKILEDINNIPSDFAEKDDIIYIGYKFTSKVISMPVINNDVTGKKRITNLIVRFYDAYKPVLVVGDKKEIFTDFDGCYSGLKEIIYPGNSQRDVYFTLTIDDPKRCNILAINAKLS